MFRFNRAEIAQQALGAIWDGAQGGARESPFASGFAYRNSRGEHEVAELEELQLHAGVVRDARPCSRLEVSEVIGTGEHLAVWWVFRDSGCADASDRASPPQPVNLEGTCMLRLHDGRVVEMWELGGELIRELPQ